jgi:hypothetical protein
MSPDGSEYTIVVDKEANGITGLLGGLLSENLDRFGDRRRVAEKMTAPIAVQSRDTAESTTVVFGPHGLAMHNGVVGVPAVTVEAGVDEILKLSQLKMACGGYVPVGFLTKTGVSVLWGLLTRKLVVKGLLRHPLKAFRFIALVSIVG